MARSAFAERLRRQRLRLGWTQQELAERAGLSTRAVSELERGANHVPRLVTVRLLCDALGLTGDGAAEFRAAAQIGSDSQLDDDVADRTEPRPAPQFEIRYAHRRDGARTAYGFVGQGPVLLIAPGFISHLEWWRTAPRNRAFLGLLTQHRSVVVYDRHGCGLSDRHRTDFTPDDDMLDIEAVADAVTRDERIDLLGDSWGARPTALFAARHPERVRRLVLYGATAPGMISDPFVERSAALSALRRTDFDLFARATAMTLFPDGLDGETLDIIVPLLRNSATPDMWERLESVRFDLAGVVGQIHVPTLVVHRRDDCAAPFAHGQQLASRIPDAVFVPLEGRIHPMWAGDYESVASAIMEFLLRQTR